jgi:Raf kinase inhibitor-like YbhB/YbcL family protein
MLANGARKMRYSTMGGMASLVLLAGAVEGASAGPSGLVLSSSAFQSGQTIPSTYVLNDYGCSGSDRSPPLKWSGAPLGTKSFALTVFDLDEHATPSGWWHWVIYDIPAQVHDLGPGVGAAGGRLLPNGSSLGRADSGNIAYDGPCPGSGTGPHRYLFTLYALSVEKLPVPADAGGAMVTFAAREYTLAKATLVGVYARP